MSEKRIKIVENILNANDQIALKNRQRINEAGVYSINLMASPGAGKTSFILATIKSLLNENIQIGVIEGDTAPVTIDSDKISAAGMPAVQVNTGGQCHLDSVMIENALDQLPLDDLDLLVVENVGNLICPAAFKLGTHSNVLIASVPEGDDKPYKYPNIYRGLDVLIINKVDLLPYLDFDMDYFRKGVEMLNPGLQTFAVSCKTNQGIEDWLTWLRLRISKK
ncbi:MAG: hydrogenase nickel incorporation protein HypB [Brevefilum sp.]|nr:hydrogenase nickel incorporation protein HypB [Brevefilum sp.]MDT8381087.1 hydrogenase nickel incorporation protein HypB [Brevefilum sp.]